MGRVPLFCGSREQDRASEAIDQLLQDGYPAHSLLTCLQKATQSGHEALAQKLLSFGVPIIMDIIDEAIRRQSVGLLRLFLEHGWDINEEVERCYPSALSIAIYTQADESVVQWFLKNGADPNLRCKMDVTPFSIAVQEATMPVLELLFSHTRHPRNGQLLHHCARRTLQDSGEVMKLVLEKCPDLQFNDIMYHNHAFCFALRSFIALGTPLHEAAKFGTKQVAQILLDKGADVTARTTRGRTAYELA
ncbi:ankyrin [Teratosphaeria nubilosa]|uniref:Ankyrin n=1 Tax=Teratosphaeria nubilosa TaxID=161662 RepID=A0A6G1LJ14_9PEZI|nr:ankyrin [Teratosphaeria nubilosa]